ncbi:MAG: P1 family peptidase [Chloroflexi bacterium]|nr:P1 family peptidase [Chloroflexota bacterium]
MTEQRTRPGPHDAITDVPGIEAGHYTDLDNATGCTVVLARAGATPGVFQPGGAPGTLDTDLAVAENSIQEIHAVLLTGGSTIGLNAAEGVRRYLKEAGVGLPLMPELAPLPLTMGAVVFDLMIGNAVHPSGESGYIASSAASSGPIEQGSVGVGTGCTVAKTGGPDTLLKGGVGTASLAHESGLIVGALVATNSVGDIVDPSNGELAAGSRGEQPGEMSRSSQALLNRSLAEFEEQQQSRPNFSSDTAGTNTTLAVIATNARLHKGTAKRVSIMGSAGLARTIDPVFTPGDGDTIFTLATGEVDVTSIPAMLTLTGTMAAEAVAAATLRSVREATSLAGVPSASDWQSSSGADG